MRKKPINLNSLSNYLTLTSSKPSNGSNLMQAILIKAF